FPLSFHPLAEPFAHAARCAGEQNKFWEMHDRIFIEQAKFGTGTVSNVTLDTIKGWSTEMGFNSTQFNSCVDSKKYASQIQANTRDGTNFGVSGTPSFVIGTRNGTGQLMVGAQPYATMQAAIAALE
ncbi:MAG: DsbA family protein, partial [Candidatus Diapherotrites archaeon]|nr:DsbA family protein [Candidatus Diapherotrites archaeon]